MAAALTLARRGLGQVAPNPAVGCILVKEGRVIARGWTQPGGRPHAETVALSRAGDAARGATAYVTLEPCSHTGKTGPCAEALIKAGIVRVVAAMVDPDPRVAGRGLDMLRQAGIAVVTPCLEAEARDLNIGFLSKLRGRPMVLIKLATSLDGKIATASGDSQWITGSGARARVHLMRAVADAIMVGVGTAGADDPELTCRLPGLGGRSPARFVLDTSLSLPLSNRLVRSAALVPTTILAGAGRVDGPRRKAFEAAGVKVVEIARDLRGSVDVSAALSFLAAQGVTRLMVEGGGRLAASLITERLVDQLAWFRGGVVIGGDGRPAVAGLGLSKLAEAGRYALVSVERFGDDLLEIYRPTA